MSTKQHSTEKGEQPDKTGKFQSGTRRIRQSHTNSHDDHTHSSRSNRKPGQPLSRPHHHGNTVGGATPSGRDSSRNKTGNWESATHSRSRGNQKDSEQYRTKSRDVGHAQSRDGHTHSHHSKTHRHTKSTGKQPHPPNQSTQLNNQEEEGGGTIIEQRSSSSLLQANNDVEDSSTTDNLTVPPNCNNNDSSEVCNNGGSNNSTEDSNNSAEEEGEEKNSSRHVYDRDQLLALKECTLSLLTPAGFDSMETEVVKDILKRHNSSSSNNEIGDNENELLNEDFKPPKHPSTLTLIREHDTKTHSKVSLTPQRRSFGSGCSWRESPIKAPPTNETEPEKDEVFHHNNHHYTTTPTTHHAPKVIDHIPYRSRGKGEWQETPPSRRRVNSWREAPPTKDSDDEPEWMSYGPSDPTEIMELKGIDEHELEKEARKSNDSLLEDKQDDITPDPSPSSSSSPPGGSKGDSDSGLPSCSPLDDEHEYMLDGFDFSTGVSICQTLASDSEEESNDPIPNNANKYQLTTALMNVLNIPGEHQEGVVNETPTRSLRVMTLDEIEEPHPQDNGDQDQTAFNKLLAAINSPRGSEPRPQRNEPHPQKPPQEINSMGVVSDINRMIFTTEEQEHYQTHRYQDNQTNRVQHYRQEEQWTASHWGTHSYRPPLFKPHSSTVGIQPNSHLRQAPPLPAQPTSNWIAEMEHRRRAELLIMEERQRAASHLQQVQRSASGGTSIGFLPTAVIRQMHSKTLTPSHQPNQIEHNTSQHERDYLRMTPQTVVTGHHFHPPPPLLPPHLRGVASSQHHIRSVGGTTVRQIDPMGGASGYPPSSHAHHLQMMPPYRIAYQQ